jgi:hypothetical protein
MLLYQEIRKDGRWKNKQNIIIKDVCYELKDKFIYLGSLITEDNEIAEEIKERLAKGSRCYFSLLPILKFRRVSREYKVKIYKMVIKPCVSYGAELWTLTKNECGKAVWERKVLHRIYGTKYVNNEWKP